MSNMATQSCRQLCEGHMKEWEVTQSTLSALRSKVDELQVRENEAIQRERSAQEQLRACLARELELLSVLDEVKRGIMSLRATPHSTQIPTCAEPLKLSLDATGMGPQTPAQLISFRHMLHCSPGKAHPTNEIPIAEAQGVDEASIALSSGNFLDNKVEVGHSLNGSPRLTSDVVGPISSVKVSGVETSVLPVIPEAEPLTEVALLEPKTQEQRDIILQPVHSQPEKETSNYETQRLSDDSKPLETIANHKSLVGELNVTLEGVQENVSHAGFDNRQDGGRGQQGSEMLSDEGLGSNLVVSPLELGDTTICTSEAHHELSPHSGSQSSDAMRANSGSHGTRKRRRRTLVQASSDEEDEDHVPSKKKLFQTTVGVMEQANSGSQASHEMPANSGSRGTRKRRRRNVVQASSDEEDQDPSPSPKKRLFKATFDTLAASNASPLQKGLQRSSSTPESPGRTAVVRMEFGGGISVLEVVKKEPENMDGEMILKHSFTRLKRKERVASPKPGRADATELPLKMGLRRSKRLSQSSPIMLIDAQHSEEDRSDSSDADSDSFIVDSSEESSGSGTQEKLPKPREQQSTFFLDLSSSDSDCNPPLRCRVRPTREKPTSSSDTQPHSPQCSLPSSEAGKVVRASLKDLEEEDSDDEHDSLDGFIVRDESSNSEESGPSDGEESDSVGEGESGSQGTVREEIVRRRENLIWDFEGDMLAAIQNTGEVALQAVCALYRQQTKDERDVKGALYRNGRGFDKTNAQRGCRFAEFLVDGDKSGQLQKSARALAARFQGAVKICQDIAAHHSKQLFEIYSNNEDPFWGNPQVKFTYGAKSSAL